MEKIYIYKFLNAFNLIGEKQPLFISLAFIERRHRVGESLLFLRTPAFGASFVKPKKSRKQVSGLKNLFFFYHRNYLFLGDNGIHRIKSEIAEPPCTLTISSSAGMISHHLAVSPTQVYPWL